VIAHEASIQKSQLKLPPMWHGQVLVTVLLPSRYSNDVPTRFELTKRFANKKSQKTIVQGDEIQTSV
jgi:hypothetical protein